MLHDGCAFNGPTCPFPGSVCTLPLGGRSLSALSEVPVVVDAMRPHRGVLHPGVPLVEDPHQARFQHVAHRVSQALNTQQGRSTAVPYNRRVFRQVHACVAKPNFPALGAVHDSKAGTHLSVQHLIPLLFSILLLAAIQYSLSNPCLSCLSTPHSSSYAKPHHLPQENAYYAAVWRPESFFCVCLDFVFQACPEGLSK